MKKLLLIMMLCACGYSSKSSELSGQPKNIEHNTPLICMNYDSVDISLGVMRNGVGSMSTQDVYLYVPSQNDIDTLNQAIKDGKLVKITYDEARITFCVPEKVVRKIEVL